MCYTVSHDLFSVVGYKPALQAAVFFRATIWVPRVVHVHANEHIHKLYDPKIS